MFGSPLTNRKKKEFFRDSKAWGRFEILTLPGGFVSGMFGSPLPNREKKEFFRDSKAWGRFEILTLPGGFVSGMFGSPSPGPGEGVRGRGMKDRWWPSAAECPVVSLFGELFLR
jgi:hypothetical protein